MKVLFLMSYPPVPPRFGGALRVYHMLKSLVKDHEVTLVVYGTPEDGRRIHAEFGLPLSRIHILQPTWMQRYKRLGQLAALWAGRSYFCYQLDDDHLRRTVDALCARQDFDIVLNDVHAIEPERFNPGAVKIFHAHNVEHDNFRQMWRRARSPIRRWHYRREYRKVEREELDFIRRHDALFVTSECDKMKFDASVPEVPKFVVPNGVDTAYFRPSPQMPEPHTLVFTGMMGYVPNADAMIYFLDEIFPLIRQAVPETKIYIVGQRPPEALMRRASDRVVVTGFVDDVRPYIHRASVYVVPLRMGSGTRLKILEAMSMQKPIVTTTIGCEGIDVVHGETVLIADDPKTFAWSVVDLMRDAALRRSLTRAGYELALSRYDWTIIGESMKAVCQDLMSAPAPQVAAGVG